MEEQLKKYKEYLESMDDEKAPLTKPKSKKVIKKEIKNIEEEEELIEIKKEKKPRPPKTKEQLEAFKKNCQKAREEKISKKKDDELLKSAKLLLEKGLKKTESESESEPEVIHLKTKTKKKPKKKIVVVHSESDSSGGSGSESDIPKPVNDFGKSHKNKKSNPVIKEVKESTEKTKPKNYLNYFVS
jgi:hypothetical protein